MVGDWDGDGIDEIQMNAKIFKWDENDPWTFFLNDIGIEIDSTSVIVAADVDGDGRDNLIYYKQLDVNEGLVFVGGYTNGKWTKLAESSVDGGGIPILVPCNLDIDENSMTLKYTFEHRLVYTEPIILAALADAAHRLTPARALRLQNPHKKPIHVKTYRKIGV